MVFRKSPGISTVTTSYPSMVSIIKDRRTTFVDTIAGVLYSLDRQVRYFLPPAHPPTLTVISSHLSFRNIWYAKARRCYFGVNSDGFFGSTTIRSWNCQSSFRTASYPYLPNILSPCFMPYCCGVVLLVITLGD